MRKGARVAVIIPVLNEEESLGKVLADIPDWVDDIIVADNGSTDGTVEVAQQHGARTTVEARRGYGSACLKGISELDDPEVVVFLDGDYSDHPEQMPSLVDPIVEGAADLVIGSRVLGTREQGALTPQARFGNQLACFLIRQFWGVRFTDLGPFRAIRYSTLLSIGMADPDYGWTVEMQIKALLHGAVVQEAPVDYRKRIGRSKVSGTVRGVIGAGYKILSTIFLSALRYHLSAKARSIPRERLLIFTRFPEPGTTKTRLIPALGAEGAADLQRQMTERVLAVSRSLDQIPVEVVYTGGSLAQFREWLGEDWEYRPQAGGDLGNRMRMAFLTAFLRRAERAVIVGVDCPELSAGIVASAFKLLEKRDVVLGPATDGGYYLIGIRRRASRRALEAVFDGIDWGTESVLGQTTKILGEAGISSGLLACLDDVDRPEDLPVWGRACGVDADSPRFSVIIPTLNEETVLPETIRRALASESTEVLVVDGGSSDETVARATECGARVMPSHACRAAQMNLGAARARGEILVFLHADTHLPAGFEDHVQRIMDQSGVIAGAFKFRTDDNSATMRFVEWWANVRSKWLKMPYGDQALFLRKDTFREIGGYRELPIMEDFELVRRLGRRGRIPIAPADAVTSCRRWRRLGTWRTMITNQLVVLAYFAGLPPRFLARFYNRDRGGTS